MFAPAHRHIPGQPAYTGHNRTTHTATGSSPYNDSHHPAQQPHHFTRSSHRPSPVPDHSSATDSAQSSPRTGTYSPAPSSSGSSSSSAKSVRWGQSDSNQEARISPGCYSMGSLKAHPKLAEIPTYGDEQLEDKHDATSATISAAMSRMKERQITLGMKFIWTALDELHIEVRICVEGFVYPCQLDFAENCEDGMVLVRTERNKSFIYQLQLLASFRVKLMDIPEYDDERLENKRCAIDDKIERNVNKMKSHQLSLYYRYQLANPQQRRRF
ncbi:unnamed protein product [Rhizoctonia solani]|uniref:Uncharacterized protein n=1 Tax=Rhizoctonia solani TaxID=456999 RepID=A0A8H3CYY7_9AGAM|nr:unnamed protein product [Rhizoctonia solani]